jgi:hypothetical protein
MPGTDPSGDASPIGEVVALVKTYALQQTKDPLKGAGRWLAVGIAGAVSLSLGLFLLSLGLLRLLQGQTTTFRGRWMSLLPYAITVVFGVVSAGIAVSRIGKGTLAKKESR